MKQKLICGSSVATVTLALCLVSGQAYGTNLVPGGTINNPAALPAGQTPTGPSTAVSSVGASNSFHDNGGWTVSKTTLGGSVNLESGVWVDPSTGDLDFFYQLQNVYSGPAASDNTLVDTFDIQDFSGVTTNVFQVTSGGTGSLFFANSGYLAPTSDTVTQVSADNSGDLMVTLSASLAPKTNSAVLVIETNAKDFDEAGDAYNLNWKSSPPANAHGAGATNPFELGALEPLLTPEPGFYGALALGIASLLLVVHGRAEKSKAKVSADKKA
jgi:hypothetical protein